MKMRCDIHINNAFRKLLLVQEREETLEHMALRLSAFILFWDFDPKMAVPMDRPPLAGQEFRPDIIGLTPGGEIALWGECGNVTLHKLNKLTRRYPSSKIVVLKSSEQAGQKLREDLRKDRTVREKQIEIWCWPAAAFASWMRAMDETVHAVGEVSGRSLNLTINEVPLAVDLRSA
ncbi:MAG TPA: YaeQ family protein [Elusimicrobiota bacterium]|nr:YaeQ family protein [Elusimicrobiota bacterium]